MSIKFCHISPTAHLEQMTASNGSHLVLAHLLEEDKEYLEFYANLDDGKEIIMDNGAFEMFKLNLPMYSPDKLINLAKQINADVVVLPDYPMQDSMVTINAAEAWIPKFKEAGFGTFFVPQSSLGHLDDFIDSIVWALENPDIDVIGLSILGCPIALGLQEQQYNGTQDSSYKMQRFLSRWAIFNILEERGILKSKSSLNKFHCLGMVDGPNEIDLLRNYAKHIRSWDTSSAVWLGLSGNACYDHSSTGLRHGKYEKEVDFSFVSNDEERISKALNNIKFINSKL